METRDILTQGLPTDSPRVITIEFYDNDCHTTFQGMWDGKMVKAAVRSVEKRYQAFKHTVTREAARGRMKLATSNGGSDEQSQG